MLRARRTTSRAIMLQFSKLIPTSKMAWIVWGISACFALMQFATQLTSADIIGGVMRSYHLSAFGGSLLISSYYYIYVLLQIPAGMLIDKYGSRRILTIGAVICVLSCYIFATANTVAIAFIGRILLGGGFAFAFVGSLALIAKWFPLEKFALMVSIVEMLGMFGGAFGGMALASLIAKAGWRSSILGFGIAAAILAVLLWGVVRDAPKRYLRVPKKPLTVEKSISMLSKAGWLFKQPTCWLNALYSGLMYSTMTVFVALWGVSYFMAEHNINMTKATFICDMAFIGVALGSPLLGWLDSKVSRRRLLLIPSCIIAAIIFAIIIYVPMSVSLTVICMFLLGMACSSYIIPFAIANEISPDGLRGASLGFVNTFSVGTAPLLQPLLGFILTHSSKAHDVSHYSVHVYHIAFSVMLLVFIASAVLGWFLPARRSY